MEQCWGSLGATDEVESTDPTEVLYKLLNERGPWFDLQGVKAPDDEAETWQDIWGDHQIDCLQVDVISFEANFSPFYNTLNPSKMLHQA